MKKVESVSLVVTIRQRLARTHAHVFRIAQRDVTTVLPNSVLVEIMKPMRTTRSVRSIMNEITIDVF